MNILIIGGAGYIGSHMVKMLIEKGYSVVTLDNLSNGYRGAVTGGKLIIGDISDCKLLDDTFNTYNFDCVYHFASYIQVGESIQQPQRYYRNNLTNTLNLLDAMIRHNCKRFIFSSTAAIFGEPIYTPIDESHPKQPINPYGRSKLMIEQILEDYDHAYGLKSICLRYFNAAGADPSGLIGECHEPETHLIPLALQVASKRRKCISVFGRDYETPDGTCIRDYIHVCDLCQAHLLGMHKLIKENTSCTFNLGNNYGYSVQEVIDTTSHITGEKIHIKDAPRRTGDPAVLVADAGAAKHELGWHPQYCELNTIIQHAWQWEKYICGKQYR